MQRRSLRQLPYEHRDLNKFVTGYLDTGTPNLDEINRYLYRADISDLERLTLGLSPNDIVTLCDKSDVFGEKFCRSDVDDVWRTLYHTDIAFSDNRSVKRGDDYEEIPITDFYTKYQSVFGRLKRMNKMAALIYAIDNKYYRLLYQLLGKTPSVLELNMVKVWTNGGDSLSDELDFYSNFIVENNKTINPRYTYSLTNDRILLDKIIQTPIDKESIVWAKKNDPDNVDLLEYYENPDEYRATHLD